MKRKKADNCRLLTFGGHIEVLKKTITRIALATAGSAAAIFCCKSATFDLLMAPGKHDFITYRTIENLGARLGHDFHFDQFHIDLISTDLSSQFMTHIKTSLYLGLLLSSPFILIEMFRFISPALYSNERHYSAIMTVIVYILFIIGALMSYYVLFPFAFRFLGTYRVTADVRSCITLDSYISTFTSLTLTTGLVFQLPVIAHILGRAGLISAGMLVKYRKHAFLAIVVTAAVITPPDIMTLILVTIPLCLLFEISIRVVRRAEHPWPKTAQHPS